MEIFKTDKIYPIMKFRKFFLAISGIFIALSIILLLFKGLNYGIDFKGGTIIQVKYSQKAPLDKIREALKKNNFDASVSKFGSDEEIIIKLSKTPSKVSANLAITMNKVLKDTGKFEVRRVDIVGPKVGDELKTKGILALVLSIAVILIYVAFRFEFKFATASILALIHDVTITLGFLSLFDITINLDILAAILTILGYSLNDTIIVFDRIRESIQNSKTKISLVELINISVSKTFSRTTLTSLTTFFVVLTLYLFGGEIINGFSFTLMIGIITGTYSSIFIASNFLVILNFSIEKYKEKEALKLKRQKEKERLRNQFEGGIV